MKYRKKDKKVRKNNKVLRRITLQIVACMALAICLLVVFFCFNPIYEKYNSLLENNIKYNVDIIGVIKSVLVYVNII